MLREYTEEKNKNHQLIKPLLKKGYTGIKITRYGAMHRGRGYVLQCDQITWQRIGYDIDGCVKTIIGLPKAAEQTKITDSILFNTVSKKTHP